MEQGDAAGEPTSSRHTATSPSLLFPETGIQIARRVHVAPFNACICSSKQCMRDVAPPARLPRRPGARRVQMVQLSVRNQSYGSIPSTAFMNARIARNGERAGMCPGTIAGILSGQPRRSLTLHQRRRPCPDLMAPRKQGLLRLGSSRFLRIRPAGSNHSCSSLDPGDVTSRCNPDRALSASLLPRQRSPS